ncbi:MAG: tRNA lysidine(34) synthetase TilS, partial [Spirochaetia bacterium]|nr:tRNA lysidine(34) synthetase TilS [Spirochaetia bacterium]
MLDFQRITDLTEEILQVTGENLFSESVHYIIAVSGGRDSMLLLYFFAGLFQSGIIPEPAVFHFNHNLRDDSEKDFHFVKEASNFLSLPVFFESKKIKEISVRMRMNLEETGRLFRYRYLKKICKTEGYDFAVTAHHADDYLESLLMHLIRGGGTSSFASLKRFDRIDGLTLFRPFVAMGRERIDELIRKYSIPYREDPGNATGVFLRNRIRHFVLPELKKEGLDPVHVWKNFHHGFEELWKSFKIKTEPGYILLDRNLIFGCPPDLSKQILDAALKRLSLSPLSLGILHELMKQAAGKTIHLSAKKYILWAAEKGPVWLMRRDSPLLKNMKLRKGNDVSQIQILYASKEKTYTVSKDQTAVIRKD